MSTVATSIKFKLTSDLNQAVGGVESATSGAAAFWG